MKLVVFRNDSLARVELEMKAAGFANFGTDLKEPDFAPIPEATGIFGVQVKDPGQLRGALGQALQHDGPAPVEVFANRQELAISPTGHADEVLDLATHNSFSEICENVKESLTR